MGHERTVTNGSQTVVGTVNYDAFGQVVGTTGSSGSSYMYGAQSAYRNDWDAGLMHVGVRYYDPQVGRFITPDSFLSENPFLYCEHDPVNFTDPTGHQGVGGPWIIGIGPSSDTRLGPTHSDFTPLVWDFNFNDDDWKIIGENTSRSGADLQALGGLIVIGNTTQNPTYKPGENNPFIPRFGPVQAVGLGLVIGGTIARYVGESLQRPR
jgi:RHS repeat-associated protein